MTPGVLLLSGEEWSQPTGSEAHGERDSSTFTSEVQDGPLSLRPSYNHLSFTRITCPDKSDHRCPACTHFLGTHRARGKVPRAVTPSCQVCGIADSQGIFFLCILKVLPRWPVFLGLPRR